MMTTILLVGYLCMVPLFFGFTLPVTKAGRIDKGTLFAVSLFWPLPLLIGTGIGLSRKLSPEDKD